MKWRIYMEYSIKDKIAKLLDEVSSIEEIRAIGQTGDINIVPKAGESDIDIFLLGDKIPGYEVRKAVYDKNSTLFEECFRR
jgi:predicted nucleotidyltransferase